MPYNDDILNQDDRQRVQALGEQWQQYAAMGNTAAANDAHAQAEAIRSKYGYSGGADGSGYYATGTNTQLRAAQPQDEAINRAIDAQIAADRAALEAAQNQKILDFEHAEAEIAPVYNTQRQNTASQYQIAARNMAERFNAMGLGSGANAQMQLSQGNEYTRNMNALDQAEAKARTDLEFERTKARTAYRDAVAQAIMDGDAARAKAIYEEAQRVDASLVATSANQMTLDLQREATEYSRKVERAKALEQYGDFSGYANLGYSAEEIAKMRRTWEAMNPDVVAIMNGGYGYSSGGSGGGSGRSSGSGSGGSGSGSGTKGNGNNGLTGNALSEYIAKNIPYYVDTTGKNADLGKSISKSMKKLF